VEIKGSPKLQPACVTRVREGMEVITRSERLARYRRQILELFFAERNHICSVCVANGNCELQALASGLGMDHVHYPYLNPNVPVDLSHELFGIDQNRCILCTRCVRVCAEIEGAHTWDIRSSGINSRAFTDFNEAWGESETCTSCGKCVNVCPTGALFKKGRAVGESARQIDFLPYLKKMREGIK
jgi:bidirectional [NiFe] hydrogenase diaphorase subunit